MKLATLLFGLFLVVGIAEGAAGWNRGGMPGSGADTSTFAQAAAALPVVPIIDDPSGDHITPPGNPIVDIVTVAAGSDSVNVTITVSFSPDTVMSNVQALIALDTDQNSATGIPPELFNELIPGTTQDLGADFVLRLFSVREGELERIFVDILDVRTAPEPLVATVPAIIIGQTLEVTVPLALLGADDGAMNVGMVLGNLEVQTDAAPNSGHGTIQRKVIISPGSSTLVTTQVFDVVFILDISGPPITGVSISLNGVDITSAVLGSPPEVGGTATGQLTARLAGISAALLGPGVHTLSILVTTPAGSFSDTVTYTVIQNFE